MCSRGYAWQSQRCDSYQKGVTSWEGKRGSGPSTHPSGEVLAWLLLLKRVFKCQFLYVWKSFCEVGLSQLLCVDWLLGSWRGMSCCHKQDSAVRLAYGAGILLCAQEGHLCFICSNLWLCSLHRAPQITWFTVMGYPPPLLSDKHKLIAAFVNSSALDAWVRACLSSCIDKSSKAIDYRCLKCFYGACLS